MTHDFKAAFRNLPNPYGEGQGDYVLPHWFDGNYDTIKRALLIADALMGEPSFETVLAAHMVTRDTERWNWSMVFKAMRDKLLEGIK